MKAYLVLSNTPYFAPLEIIVWFFFIPYFVNVVYHILGWQVFFFFVSCSTLNINILTHYLLFCRVSVEKFTDSVIVVPLYVISHFPLAASKVLSLYLTFDNLIINVLVWIYLGLSFLGFHWASWIYMSLSFSRLEMFSVIINLNKLSSPFSFFTFWDSIMCKTSTCWYPICPLNLFHSFLVSFSPLNYF